MRQSFAYRNAKISLRFAARMAWSLPTIPNGFKVSTFTTGRSGSFRKATGSSSPRLSINARIANRELGKVEKIDSAGNIRLRLESGKTAQFNLRDHPHLDYGYAMTSYTSQGQTVDRVIVHVPAKDMASPELVNQRFAYVAVSRARIDAQVYTNDASTLAERLSRDVSKKAAMQAEDFHQSGRLAPKEGHQSVQEQAQV